MEVLFVLVVGILAVAGGLRALFDRPAIASGHSPVTDQPTERRNPYANCPIEVGIRPILADPATAARIEECARNLHSARQHLAEQFGRKALTKEAVLDGYDREFCQAWKTVCDVAEAKYGHAILYKALKLAGYRRGLIFIF